MKIKLKDYELVNNLEIKVIPDGYEIFASAVNKYNIDPADFVTADWSMGGSIIVYTVD